MATSNTRWMRRYNDEATAVEAARRYSAADGRRAYYVIESPHPTEPEAGRYVVDTDGFVTNRDRLVSVYVAGKQDE